MWIGFELTLYGMGLVFLLLAVLWGLIALLIRLDSPEAAVEEGGTGVAEAPPALAAARAAEAGPTVMTVASDGALDEETLAAVVIACRAHRMARRKQAAPEMRTHQPGSLPSRWLGAGRTRQNRSWGQKGRLA